TACAWSHDSSLWASGDMAGDLFVYRTRDMATNPQPPFNFSTGSELSWLGWHPNAPVLLGGGAEGTVWVWHGGFGGNKSLSGNRYNFTILVNRSFIDSWKSIVQPM